MSEPSMNEPAMNLVATILVQAERDYHYEKMLRWEIGQFLKSEWFETICDVMGFDTEKTKKAIKEGHGLYCQTGEAIRKLYGNKGRVLTCQKNQN